MQPGDRVFVAGSTQPGEEAAALAAYQGLKGKHPRLRLFVVPRAPERFDEVARLLPGCVRRSEGRRGDVVLVDTMGELGALWGLADVAFVGGSLDGKRGGQSMIEPAALGAAVLFGPHVWNFKDAARRLLEAGAAYQVADARELASVVGRLLDDEPERRAAGVAARGVRAGPARRDGADAGDAGRGDGGAELEGGGVNDQDRPQRSHKSRAARNRSTVSRSDGLARTVCQS